MVMSCAVYVRPDARRRRRNQTRPKAQPLVGQGDNRGTGWLEKRHVGGSSIRERAGVAGDGVVACSFSWWCGQCVLHWAGDTPRGNWKSPVLFVAALASLRRHRRGRAGVGRSGREIWAVLARSCW